ncbi:hypothetical protein H920_11881 [Fukomys damarensis]|uniref:Uncharacterized protein n=1 Tax=Fukomys damarensis TaxID=885580 RepID=A0A091D8I9_FUKDA|nr:hypothetical protein H920_11881 [Fukomys damarensis]
MRLQGDSLILPTCPECLLRDGTLVTQGPTAFTPGVNGALIRASPAPNEADLIETDTHVQERALPESRAAQNGGEDIRKGFRIPHPMRLHSEHPQNHVLDPPA